ncbi:MAG: hypothetical protein EXR92_05615 [Gemmatimonadetes bacterium]|nr:hypothetical protein [Gemmatimonadota bacterium]
MSKKRQEAVSGCLAGQGVGASRMGTSGRGEAEPVASNETDACRQANRWIVLAIFAATQ